MMSIAAPAPLRAMFSRAFSSASGSLSIADDVAGAELPGGEREHARSGADVEHPRAAQIEPLQQPRHSRVVCVMPGAEPHRRLDDDDRRSLLRLRPLRRGRRHVPRRRDDRAGRPAIARQVRLRCARAQSSSGTSIGARSQTDASDARAPRAPRRGCAGVRKNTRQPSAGLVAPGWRAARSRRAARRGDRARRADRRGSRKREARAPDTQPKMSLTVSKNGFSPPSASLVSSFSCGMRLAPAPRAGASVPWSASSGRRRARST